MKRNEDKGIIATLTKAKVQLAITVGAVLIATLNLIIFSRIAPLSKDIAINVVMIEAANNRMDENFQAIHSSLERIENKIDDWGR